MHPFLIALLIIVIFVLVIAWIYRPSKRRMRVVKKQRPIKPSQTTKTVEALEATHLNMVHNAIVNDNFEWMLAHLDRLSDCYQVQHTLSKNGYPEIAGFLGDYFQLYCTAEKVEGVEWLDLDYDACYQQMWKMERDAHSIGLFKRFVNDMEL